MHDFGFSFCSSKSSDRRFRWSLRWTTNMYQDDLDDLVQYFKDLYIGRFRRNAPRQLPTFSIELWNMFHQPNEELPRTNNSTEGWHRSFQGNVSFYHPVFWKFLDILKRKQSINRVAIWQSNGGHPPPA